jgi:hypothetical protein
MWKILKSRYQRDEEEAMKFSGKGYDVVTCCCCVWIPSELLLTDDFFLFFLFRKVQHLRSLQLLFEQTTAATLDARM